MRPRPETPGGQRLALLLLMLLFTSFGLTACTSGTIHATVNRDGSAELVGRLLFDPALTSLIGDERLLAYLQQQVEAQGFTVSRIEQDGQTGLGASKHLERAEDLLPLLQPAMAGSPVKSNLQVAKQMFWTDYALDVTVDFANLPVSLDLLPGYLLQTMLRQVNLELALTLPVRPREHNAATTSDAGRTLHWTISPTDPNRLQVLARVPNLLNIAAAAGLLALLLLTLVVMSRRRR